MDVISATISLIVFVEIMLFSVINDKYIVKNAGFHKINLSWDNMKELG